MQKLIKQLNTFRIYMQKLIKQLNTFRNRADLSDSIHYRSTAIDRQSINQSIDQTNITPVSPFLAVLVQKCLPLPYDGVSFLQVGGARMEQAAVLLLGTHKSIHLAPV